MKRFLVIILCLLPFGAGAGDGSLSVPNSSAIADSPVKDCRCKGIPLHGKVKVVSNFADFNVQVVEKYSDLKVELVTKYPDNCGQWQIVDNFPDFTIAFVENWPDFKVQFVNNYPGMP